MARRTFAEYKAAVVHALGAAPATGETTSELVNDALQHLINLRPWSWRRGGPVTLSMVADQSYIELPSDFGEEESVTYPGTIATQMIRTSMSELQRMRSFTTQPTGFTYYYAVNNGSYDEDFPEEGLSVAILELYPTPTSSLTDVVSLTYRRDVPRLEDDADVPMIPPWMDFAFNLLCRSFAMTLEDDNPANSAQQMFDRLIPELMKRDAQSQHRFGVMRGGIFPTTVPIDPMYPRSIGDPTTAVP